MAPFLCRLLPPRPSFPHDMSPEEGAVMQAHGAYLRALATRGIAVAFGPVLDPKGSWGVAIFSVDSREQIEDIAKNDPAVLSGRGFSYEILPMAALVTREPASA
jgi:uncharacterized protein